MSYRLRRAGGEPRHERRSGIVVTNLFGQITVDTLRISRLLVPARMDTAGPVEPPDPTAHEVDHYQCYRARPVRGTFLPGGLRAVVKEAFEYRIYGLRKVMRLCYPVDKNGEGIVNPDHQLLCYGVQRSPGQAEHRRRIGIHTNDQLGARHASTTGRRSNELCVSSTVE